MPVRGHLLGRLPWCRIGTSLRIFLSPQTIQCRLQPTIQISNLGALGGSLFHPHCVSNHFSSPDVPHVTPYAVMICTSFLPSMDARKSTTFEGNPSRLRAMSFVALSDESNARLKSSPFRKSALFRTAHCLVDAHAELRGGSRCGCALCEPSVACADARRTCLMRILLLPGAPNGIYISKRIVGSVRFGSGGLGRQENPGARFAARLNEHDRSVFFDPN